MDYQIGDQIPSHFQPEWPGQFDLFSYFEFACGIPQLLFAITTYKEGEVPNVCPQSWSSFVSGKDGYYVVLGGLMERTHTYRNILRERCFCVNFLSKDHFDSMMRSIEHNEEEADEFKVCGFSKMPCDTIHAPRIGEGFLTLECELSQEAEAANGALKLLIGKTKHAAVLEGYAAGIDAKYGSAGFPLSVHSPINFETGICDPFAIATLKIERKLV